ncbi:potassium-transporting ATPase subunit F [Kurthia gibsonii]|nr:potassium-transporting ATPase subunit F [Kurthia gibsonii]
MLLHNGVIISRKINRRNNMLELFIVCLCIFVYLFYALLYPER